MEHVTDIVEAVCEHLGAVAKSDVVVGSPVELGTVTFVPISRISLGFGAGGGSGEGEGLQGGKHGRRKQGRGKGSGGGSGGGGRVRPVAVAVFSDSGVEILPVGDKQGKLDSLLDKVPALIERFHKE